MESGKKQFQAPIYTLTESIEHSMNNINSLQAHTEAHAGRSPTALQFVEPSKLVTADAAASAFAFADVN